MPFVILLAATACDSRDKPQPELSAEQQTQLDNFIYRIKSEMVYMPAGTFLMGDFCSEMRGGGSYCTADKDNKPAHRVELSAFSISKFKITHEDYNFYLSMSGFKRQHYNDDIDDKLLSEMTILKRGPAIISWGEADSYCRWLRAQTGLKFSLPTEAQWEYAARDRGKYISHATDDGTLRHNRKTERGENYATDEDREIAAKPLGTDPLFIHFPVDNYPPSPSGLYGMADNGREWVMDWYDPEWYTKSPVKDPQGPERGVIKSKVSDQYWKVLRGATRPTPGRPSGLTFSRSYKVPEPGFPAGITARCVANEPHPLSAMENGS